MIKLSMVSIILSIIVICINCKEKDTGIQDYVWQEESLKMAGEICIKVKECGLGTGALHGLNSNQAKLIDKKLTEASCKNYHRKTNAYQLIGEDPEFIKKNSRDCHNRMVSMECQDIVNKKFLDIQSCVELGRIQKPK